MFQRITILGLTVAMLGLTGCNDANTTDGGEGSKFYNNNADPTAEYLEPIVPRQSDIALGLWNSPRFTRQFLESYKAETEVEPGVNAEESPVLTEIVEYYQDDDLDKAIELLKANQRDESSAVFDFLLGNIYFQMASDDGVSEQQEAEYLAQAVAAYQVSVAKFPKFRRAWRNLGMIHARQSNWAKAQVPLVKVIELGGSDAITYGLLGFAYTQNENHISAESAFRMANLLDPFTVDWQMGMAQSFFKQGRYQEAVALADKLIAQNSGNADLWLLQANALVQAGQPLKAAENFEFVAQLGQATVDSLNTTGDIYTNEGLFSMAVDAYVRAMQMQDEPDVRRAVRAANVMTVQGAYDQTANLIAKIEELGGDRLDDETRKDLLRLRARAAAAEGGGEREKDILVEIVALDPHDGDALILLGRYYTRQKDYDQAAHYFDRATELEKFEPDALVRWAEMLVGQGPEKYDEAISKLRRSLQLKPRENVQEFLESVEEANRKR